MKTKKCKSCLFWEKKKDSPKYIDCKDKHVCNVNHQGSASAMETVGTLDIFKRSIEKRNLRYTTYIGDGDSSAHPSVVEADPYDGEPINKGECIGHVQKRVGKNLRDMRKTLPSDRKKAIFGTGGRNKLTDSAINYIQNCYGLAIRQNTNNLYQMKKNVSAIMSHCSDIPDASVRHKWCPRTEDSWCSYWNTTTKSKDHKCRLNLPPSIRNEPEIVKLFDRLRDDELLRKCLHGKTQNVNEPFNGIVWTRCPKRVFVTKTTLEIGVNSAIIEFNEGTRGIERVIQLIGLPIGKHQSMQNEKSRKHKLKFKNLKSSSPVKRRGKSLRAERKTGMIRPKKRKEHCMSMGLDFE